jgi:hypothetical protein
MVFIFVTCRVQGLFDPDCGREVIDLTTAREVIDLTMDEDEEEEEEEEEQEEEEEATDEPHPDTVQSLIDSGYDDVLDEINNEMMDAALEEHRIEMERAAFEEEEEIAGGILEQQRLEREDEMVEAYEEEMQMRREHIQQIHQDIDERLKLLESVRLAEERRSVLAMTLEEIQEKVRDYTGAPSIDVRKEIPLMAEENFHQNDQIQAASQELADDIMDVDFLFEQPPQRCGFSPLNPDHYTAMGSPKLTEEQLKRFNENLFYQFKINVLDHTNYCAVSYDPNNIDAMWEKFASDYMHRFHMTAIIRRNDAAHARNGEN